MTEGRKVWFTTREAAAILRVSTVAVRSMIRAGRMQAKRVGREWRIPASEVLPSEPEK